jgi:hypothetical protein
MSQTTNRTTSLLRQAFSQPAFIVVALMLLVAAAGLNAATHYLQLYFRKLPVAPARELSEVPQHLGRWLQVSIDEPLTAEFQDALATDKYIFRDYVDTRLATAQELAEFRDKTPAQCRMLAQRLQLKKPAAVVNFALTYYTGLADTVAHIPERCYIADGYEPTKWDVEAWSSLKGRPAEPAGDPKVRFIVFEDPLAAGMSVKRNVAYFFHCNGKYMNDSIAVRKQMAYLLEKYGYYVKIELQTWNLPQQEATQVMDDFLGSAVTEIEKCVPDWKKLRSSPGMTGPAAVAP